MYNFLIIENDNPTYLFLRRLILSLCKCTILRAENGLEGIYLIENERIDGVFIDIATPRKDGLEILSTIRKETKLKNLPVIMISTFNMRGQLEKALRLNVFDYIIRPLLLRQTYLRIKKFLEFIEQVKSAKDASHYDIKCKKIMIISQKNNEWDFLKDKLKRKFIISIFTSAPDGIEYFLTDHPDIIILDNGLSLMNEKLIARKLKKIHTENSSKKNDKITIIGLNTDNEKSLSQDEFDFFVNDKEELITVIEDAAKSDF